MMMTLDFNVLLVKAIDFFFVVGPNHHYRATKSFISIKLFLRVQEQMPLRKSSNEVSPVQFQIQTLQNSTSVNYCDHDNKYCWRPKNKRVNTPCSLVTL
jgi:hypothetical protein